MEKQTSSMTDNEYSILDELYFLSSYVDLKQNVNLSDEELQDELRGMIEKNWLTIFLNDDSLEVDYDSKKFRQNFKSYYYLASKKGLFEHNTN